MLQRNNHAKRPTQRKRASANQASSFHFENLEDRKMMAIASLGWANDNSGTLVLRSNDAATTVQVVDHGSSFQIQDRSTSNMRTWNFTKTVLKQIEFHGSRFNDYFSVFGLNLRSTAYGYGGHDTLVGGNLRDVFYGGTGNDKLYGNGGDDILVGGDGNDLLHAGNGTDYLYGQKGNDRLVGLFGKNYLYGGEGNDGLIGGHQDVLHGGLHADRFLTLGNSTISDRAAMDARIQLKNGTSQWTWKELQVLDEAFEELQKASGWNTRMLKDTTSTRDLVFQKESSSFASLGMNTETKVTQRYWDILAFTWRTRHVRTDRLIQIRDFNEENSAARDQAKDTVIHEIAHNWDSAQERTNRGIAGNTWNTFTNISGWRTSSTANHFRSGDGNWYYSKASRNGFLGGMVYSSVLRTNLNYGKFNPVEDWATSFETYFRTLRNSGSFSNFNAVAKAKLNSVNNFVASVRGLG